ncbi:MAG TPA: response regulator [Phycisphaerales bacterium]|nr:response regulator [Phycisphaerales bacterium]
MRVLVIEDSEAVRRLQRSMLVHLGHADIAEAVTVAEGLALCERFGPEMVLCDASLPDQDGVEFVRAFRARDAATPVVFMASTGDMGSVIPAIRAGADEALIKPFSPEDLAECLHAAIEARKAA